MKIGIFDSGLGGLVILRAIRKTLPQYDYVYFGDTKRLPYGKRSQAEIYRFTKQGVKFLFEQDCGLVILACNTASSQALRKIQREFLPKYDPDKKVLGVIIPTAEEVTSGRFHRVGILATIATVKSKAYLKELKKLNKNLTVIQQAAPLLVPLIEANRKKKIDQILRLYLRKIIEKKVGAVILACTHYPLVSGEIKKILPHGTAVLGQDKIIPKKLKEYLKHHSEIVKKLSRGATCRLYVSKTSKHYENLGKKWFGTRTKLTAVKV